MAYSLKAKWLRRCIGTRKDGAQCQAVCHVGRLPWALHQALRTLEAYSACLV